MMQQWNTNPNKQAHLNVAKLFTQEITFEHILNNNMCLIMHAVWIVIQTQEMNKLNWKCSVGLFVLKCFNDFLVFSNTRWLLWMAQYKISMFPFFSSKIIQCFLSLLQKLFDISLVQNFIIFIKVLSAFATFRLTTWHFFKISFIKYLKKDHKILLEISLKIVRIQ